MPERQEVSRPESKEVHPRIGIGEYALVAQPEVDGETWENIADGQPGGWAGDLLVDGIPVGIGDLVTIGIDLNDIGAAEGIAYVWFEIETGSGKVLGGHSSEFQLGLRG